MYNFGFILSLTGKLQDKLQDFLSKLLDGSEGSPIKSPPLRHERTQDLYKEYATAMQLVGLSSADEPVEQWPQVQRTHVCWMKGVWSSGDDVRVILLWHTAETMHILSAIKWLSYDYHVTLTWSKCGLHEEPMDVAVVGDIVIGWSSAYVGSCWCCKHGMWRLRGNHMIWFTRRMCITWRSHDECVIVMFMQL